MLEFRAYLTELQRSTYKELCLIRTMNIHVSSKPSSLMSKRGAWCSVLLQFTASVSLCVYLATLHLFFPLVSLFVGMRCLASGAGESGQVCPSCVALKDKKAHRQIKRFHRTG